MPAVYVPSILEEVVDNPEIEMISRFSKLCGLSAKIKYSPLDSPGSNSTFSKMLEATLILLTDLPFNLLILAVTFPPPVLSLLNSNSSPTLYSLPPVTIPILEICPGVAAVMDPV